MENTFDVRVTCPVRSGEPIVREFTDCTSIMSNLHGVLITCNADNTRGYDTFQVGNKCKVEIIAMR